jgi:hypothetical protein
MVSVANRKILFPGETEWFQIFLFETFFLFLIKNNGFCCKQKNSVSRGNRMVSNIFI